MMPEDEYKIILEYYGLLKSLVRHSNEILFSCKSKFIRLISSTCPNSELSHIHKFLVIHDLFTVKNNVSCVL